MFIKGKTAIIGFSFSYICFFNAIEPLTGAVKLYNQYKTQSLRLQNWDYGWNGAYFITVCTQNRENILGDIIDEQCKLSPLGIIADILWYEIKNHAQHVELGEFVVMPNHIHGVLILNGNDVETRHALSLRTSQSPIGQSRFQNQGKNTISAIVGSYKSAVSKHAHRLGYEFAWQRNYWEHIIRNENEYAHITQYILDNPKKWAMDKLNGGVGNQVMESPAMYGRTNDEDWMI